VSQIAGPEGDDRGGVRFWMRRFQGGNGAGGSDGTARRLRAVQAWNDVVTLVFKSASNIDQTSIPLFRR